MGVKGERSRIVSDLAVRRVGKDAIRSVRLAVKPDGMVSEEVISKTRKTGTKVHKKEHQSAHKWIFAVQTCAQESYVRQLETQLSTWLSPVNKDHVLIVGGPHNNGDRAFACDEGVHGQNCKEASVLYRSAGLAEEVDADWLFHAIDDAYVFLPRVEEAMASFDPSEPRVFANLGCGAFWEHHKESQGGKIPKPTDWVEPQASCKRVEREGGICTGGGYIVSRGALKLLRRNHTLPSFIEHYVNQSKGTASDSTSTCLFYDRNITVGPLPEGVIMAQARTDTTAESIVAEHSYGLVHVHLGGDKAAIPAFMRKLHAAEEMVSQ
jgi:hypothetical protein